MSLTEGKVIGIDEVQRIVKIQPSKKSGSKKDVMEYKIPGRIAMMVEKGQEIKENQPLCEGSLDLKKLYKSAGVEPTQRYILQEVQKIYSSQGVDINDKHIEVIIQKMFSRVRVKEEGDSDWIRGEVVERVIFNEEVEKLRDQLTSRFGHLADDALSHGLEQLVCYRTDTGASWQTSCIGASSCMRSWPRCMYVAWCTESAPSSPQMRHRPR